MHENIQKLKGALLAKKWHEVFEVTMRDSNQLHAVCLDTFPPISYMNSVSFDVISLINKFNGCFDEFVSKLMRMQCLILMV